MAYTASFLTVNGLPVYLTDTGKRRDDVARFGRGNGTTFAGTTFAKKGQLAVETPPMTAQDAHSLSGWLRGVGHHWTYQWEDSVGTTRFTLYSSDGGAYFAGGSVYTPDPKYGSYSMLVGSGDSHVATAQFGSETPHSFSVWRNQLNVGEWELCSAVYDGATTRYFAGTTGTGITTAFAWCVFLHTTGFVRFGLQGETPSGSNTACAYAGAMLVPYSLTTAQLTARNERLIAEPGFPLVAVGGHHTRSLQEVAFRGFVSDYPVHRVMVDGAWRDNARRVVGVMRESHPLEPELPAPPASFEELITEQQGANLWGYWPLTEATGASTTMDLGPNGYHLDVFDNETYNDHTWGAADSGVAELPSMLRFDRASGDPSNASYIYRAASASAFPSQSFSVSWVGNCEYDADFPSNVWGYDCYPIVIYQPGNATNVIKVYTSSAFFPGNSFVVYVNFDSFGYTSPDLDPPSTFFSTTVSHWAVTVDIQPTTYRVRVYQNGSEIHDSGTVSASWSLNTSASRAVSLGMLGTVTEPPTSTGSWNASKYNGLLAHVALWNRVLSAAEILAQAEALGLA